MKLSPEKMKSLCLAVLGMGLLIFCSWYFGVQWLLTKKSRDSKELVKIKGEIQQQTQAIATEKSNREAAKSYLSVIQAFEDQMPKGNTETWLVTQLSELAARHQLQINNTVIQPIPEISDFKFKGQPYRLEGFRFEFKGEINQIGTFLEDLENNLPLMEVDDLSITAGSDIAPHIHVVSIRVSMATKS